MAKWIKAKDRDVCIYGNGYRECSHCHQIVYLPLDYLFCPMCGVSVDVPKSKNYNDFEDEVEEANQDALGYEQAKLDMFYQKGREDAYNDVIHYLGCANGIEEKCIKDYCENKIKEQEND